MNKKALWIGIVVLVLIIGGVAYAMNKEKTNEMMAPADSAMMQDASTSDGMMMHDDIQASTSGAMMHDDAMMKQ